jgi:hypothetical protein
MEAKHCCEQMAYYLNLKCDIHDDPFDCPDNIVFYNLQFDEYGIIIHDGGHSYITIGYCPWCGKELPEAKRDLWFDEMEKLGIESPFEDEIPEEYKTDAWWRKKTAQG